MQQQFQRLNIMFGEIKDKMDKQDAAIAKLYQTHDGSPNLRRNDANDNFNDDYEDALNNDAQNSNFSMDKIMRGRGSQREQNLTRWGDRQDHDLCSIKMKIPPFQGKNDPDVYLEWEKKLVLSRRKNREHPIDTWEKMKTVMRKRFVPSHYYRDLYQRLQALSQGSKSVEDYHKEMEIVIVRANVEKDREATMARFVHGLNRAIANVVELQHWWDQLVLSRHKNQEHPIDTWEKMKTVMRKRFVPSHYYHDLYQRLQALSQRSKSVEDYHKEMEIVMHYVKLEDMVHMVMKVERQLKRKETTSRTGQNSVSSSSQKLNWSKKEENSTFKPKTIASNSKEVGSNEKSKTEDEEIETEGESNDESMPPSEDANDGVEDAVDRELLVTRRALNVQAKEDDEVQRDNIFHTRCHVKNKLGAIRVEEIGAGVEEIRTGAVGVESTGDGGGILVAEDACRLTFAMNS
ncbi:hypothetical protein SLEP1_g12658 [Rubroshorea leprosula]|uniref:Retrotransposon gag domain-containing protein n=1 Tax=Rubroshorea leprosula TaxID=152421 RepID=A0AAV5IJ32_9ROSI|nr:hypothetical protein SLEP1_g12658 [Rubroshorea leprosula]